MAGASNGYNAYRKAHTGSQNPPRSVPTWEKRFCWEVGSVPWKRLVEAKKYIHVFSGVVEWNDSACEEAFKKAKLRYWSKINGLPCNIPLPNPDMHIDKIDWNAEIDHVLFQGLDEASAEEVEEEDKENVNMVNSFNIPMHQIKPTGWDLYDRKCKLLTGMVVGE